MADAITGLIGAILMITFLLLIATKLNELPVWIVCFVGIASMLWSFWIDDFEPLLPRRSN
ncbi:MAG TPA: hypothetical protein VH934_17120 [Xanthobacteraceae bacterium]|jgi:hypothetical protein